MMGLCQSAEIYEYGVGTPDSATGVLTADTRDAGGTACSVPRHFLRGMLFELRVDDLAEIPVLCENLE